MRPINIKNMMALIEKEPDDQYIRVLKLVFLQALMEIKQLRRKNSQLGGKVARYRKKILRQSLCKLDLMNVTT